MRRGAGRGRNGREGGSFGVGCQERFTGENGRRALGEKNFNFYDWRIA
jgi:hypothetical protein